MECCRPLQFSGHILRQHSPKCIEKYCVPIKNYACWYIKMHPDILKKKFVVYFPLIFFLQGMRIYILLNLSNTTNK